MSAAIYCLAALLVAVNWLGRGAKRTVRVYDLTIGGNPWRAKMVIASRWLRALIRVRILPEKRAGMTVTGHGWTRDPLGVVKLNLLLHEMGHQVQRALLPVRIHPRLKIVVWPVYYFRHQARLEEWAKLFERLMLDPAADSSTLPEIHRGVPAPRVHIDPQIYGDGARS